ncbi:MAG: NAD(P)H-dependent oxidoreductase [Pseudomonadota bacterium]
MKILAFAASNSRTSINRALVEFAAARLQAEHAPGAEVDFIDIHDFEMPIYSPEREADGGVPSQARAFLDRLDAADAVIVSFAEHNGFVTAAWKNLFDWMSRLERKIWRDKPMVLLAASPGPRAGAGVLASQEKLAPFFGGDVRGMHGVGPWSKAWDADAKALTRPEDLAALDKALSALR